MTRMLALPILLALPFVAVAQPDEINYLYLELGYEQTEFELPGADQDASGYRIEGSVPLREHVHFVGGYSTLELDDVADADSVEKHIGIGTQWSFGRKLSVFGQFGLMDADLDFGVGNFEDDGVFANAGVRFMPVPGWEIRGGVRYYDLDLLGNDTSGWIASELFVTDVVALTLSLEAADDDESLAIGARFYFGNEPQPSSYGR